MGTQPLEMNSQKVVFTVEAVVFFLLLHGKTAC